jgi:FAD/FMN-containing dehydrogenase
MTAFFQSANFRSWGGTTRPLHYLARPESERELTPLMVEAQAAGKKILAVGLGRSYGDSCLNSNGALMVMTGLRRVLRFDRAAGTLHVEAGISLRDIARITIPQGFSLPVLPGTQHVTLGGAIANDVHGKNHETAGTFGCHIRRLQLLRSDGVLHNLKPGDPLFAATIGGLGLTGVITSAEIQLEPLRTSQMDVQNIGFSGLNEFLGINEGSVTDFPYSAAWIDCAQLASLAGIYSRGRVSNDGPLEPPGNNTGWKVPVEFPWSLVNRSTLRVLNTAYYAAHRPSKGMRHVHMNSFLHPLDHISEWNRLYGRRGFFQYQLVVPTLATAAIPECVRQISKTDQRPSLAVLKAFGSRRSPGLLSFPVEGLTFALDFPNKGRPTLRLLERLDAVVREAKGRVYLAKDGHMSTQTIHALYPRMGEFAAHVDSAFCSDLWKRATA